MEMIHHLVLWILVACHITYSAQQGNNNDYGGMHVRCTENYMQLTLDRQRYAKIDPASLHLTDPNCGPTFYNDTLMFIRAPLGSCGTVAGRSGILLEFRNEVYGDLAGRSTMAQEPAYQFRLRCRYYTTAKLMRRSPINVHGCRIKINANNAIAKPQYNNRQPGNIYSCTPDSSSTQYEVHVLAVYEGNRHTRPPSAGDTNVNIVSGGQSSRPIILVLGSYEPVNWILNLPAGISIRKVILVAYYIAQSSVSGDVNQVQAVERKTWQWGMGYGSDSGGGDTVALLKQVHRRFGVVTSFTGTYKADQWTLTFSPSQGHGHTSATPPLVIPTTTTTTTPKPTLHRQRCYFNNYCPGYRKMNAVCRGGYCVCTSQYYDYNSCLPNAYGCKILANSDKAFAKPQYNKQPARKIYSCTPGNSSSQYEVHVLSVYEVINRRPPSAGNATVNIVSRGRSERPVILVLGSYEPVNWILNLPADITISKVVLVAYYIAQSSVSGDVNQVQAVERKTWQWSTGYGSDSGGGDTVALLRQVHSKFGAVTSFTGTYRADEWSLELSPQGQYGTPCQTIVCLSEDIKKLNKVVKQMAEELKSQQERLTILEQDKN